MQVILVEEKKDKKDKAEEVYVVEVQKEDKKKDKKKEDKKVGGGVGTLCGGSNPPTDPSWASWLMAQPPQPSAAWCPVGSRLCSLSAVRCTGCTALPVAGPSCRVCSVPHEPETDACATQ